MFKICVTLFVLLTVAFGAPAPKPVPNPKAKPTFYTTAYTIPAALTAPVVAYTSDLAAPVVYGDEYYEPAALYTAYSAPIVVY